MVTFHSAFEGGNLEKAEKVGIDTYALTIRKGKHLVARPKAIGYAYSSSLPRPNKPMRVLVLFPRRPSPSEYNPPL